MGLNRQGYAIIDLPERSPKLLQSFENLHFDKYAGNSRYRRFSQYKMTHDGIRWGFERLPHRAYVTFAKYNPIAGGIKREYAPLEADFTPHLAAAAEGFELDIKCAWQINVHQIRVVAKGINPGIVVPEGPHQDGHEYVFIGVFNRHCIDGGELRLIPLENNAAEPFFRAALPAGEGVLIKDLEMWHDASPIRVVGDADFGYRDTLIAPFSKWTERWYGDEFDTRAIGESPA